MADSLKVYSSVTNATTTRSYGPGSSTYTITRTDSGEYHIRMTVGTSEETITLPADVSASVGAVMAINHDDTNYVEIGVATGVYFAEVQPEQDIRSFGPEATTAFYVKADTAACDFELHVWAK